jgi:hypothetical protein
LFQRGRGRFHWYTFSPLLGGLSVYPISLPSGTWWLGDSVGALFVTAFSFGLKILKSTEPHPDCRTRLSLFGLVAIAWFVFGNGFSTLVKTIRRISLLPISDLGRVPLWPPQAATAICVLAILDLGHRSWLRPLR